MHIAYLGDECETMEMAMAMNLNDALGIHAQALELRGYRAQLLATNIANADTPNYKAVDVNFKTALSQAQEQAGQIPLAVTSTNHIQTAGENESQYQVMYRTPMQPALDGNTVDGQIEQVQFAQNSVEYQASLTLLNNNIKNIMTAIQGQ